MECAARCANAAWPWSRTTTAILVPYTIASCTFLAAFFVALGPNIVSTVSAYPRLLERFAHGVIHSRERLDFALAISILSSTWFISIALALAWRGVDGTVGVFRSLRGSER